MGSRRAVVERVEPLLFLAVTRPVAQADINTHYAALLSRPEVVLHRLQTLTEAGALALMANCLGVAEVPAEVAALIYARAEGNPFFTEELTFGLRDAGVLRVADCVCQLAQGRGRGLGSGSTRHRPRCGDPTYRPT